MFVSKMGGRSFWTTLSPWGRGMTSIDIPVIKTDALHSEATYVAPAVNVRLVGSAESEALGPLGDLLGRLHGEAVRLAVREVTVDVRELEFMNSLCFKTFVSWLGELQELDPGRRYRIRFLSDENKHWQRPSLRVLSGVAADLVRVA
jgi:hypothetical protein